MAHAEKFKRPSGNTLVELSTYKWSLCVAEFQRNNHFLAGCVGLRFEYEAIGCWDFLLPAEKDNFYSSEATAEERANTRLTMEIPIENEP